MAQRRARAMPVAVLSLLLALCLLGVGTDRAAPDGRNRHTAAAVVVTPAPGGFAPGTGNRPEQALFAGSPRGAGWLTTTAATVSTGVTRWLGRLGWWSPALPELSLAAGGPESRRGRAPPVAVGT